MSVCTLEKEGLVLGFLRLGLPKLEKNVDTISKILKIKTGVSLEKCFSEDFLTPEGLSYLRKLLTKYGINYSKFDTNESAVEGVTKNTVVSNFLSPEIDDLFHTKEVAKNYFKQSTKSMIAKYAFIGIGEDFVLDEKELNDNFKQLKNTLFATICRFLNKPVSTIYDANGNLTNLSTYTSYIKELDSKLYNEYSVKSYTGRLVPRLEGRLNNATERAKYDAFNAGVFLVNFDNVVEHLYGDIISIDQGAFNDFNALASNSNKYKINISGIPTIYWKQDTHEAEDATANETSLAKMMIEIIPQLNKKGEFTGQFLSTNDFYVLASRIREFELRNVNTLTTLKDTNWTSIDNDPTRMLKWYVTNIVNAYEQNFGGGTLNGLLSTYFKDNIEIAKSLNAFIYDGDIEAKENKGNKSITGLYTLLLRNTFGATYITYDAEKKNVEYTEMYKHNSNRIQVQNSVYNFLAERSAEKNSYSSATVDKYFEGINSDQDLLSINTDLEPVNKAFKKLVKDYFGIALNVNTISAIYPGLIYGKSITRYTVLNLKSNLYALMAAANTDISTVIAREKAITTGVTAAEGTESAAISFVVKDPLFIEIRDNFLASHMNRAIMNVTTKEGSKMPTFKTANMTYNDVSLIEGHANLYPSEGRFKSLLLQKDSPLLGTGTKLEIATNKSGKDASKFSIAENFTSSFVYEFLKSLKGNNTFSLVLGNYSDKNSILTKIFSGDAAANQKKLLTSDIKDILEVVRTQALRFNMDTFLDIFTEYQKLFDALENGIKLEQFKNTNSFNHNVKIINKYLAENNVSKDLAKVFEPGKFNIVEELHYSTYKVIDASGKSKKQTALNQALVDYYRIFSSTENFKTFVNRTEANFVKDCNNEGVSSQIDFQLKRDEKLIDYYKMLSLNVENDPTVQFNEITELYAGENRIRKEVSGAKLFTIDDKTKNVTLNSLVRKWMWISSLYRNEYLFISTKGEYIHPHKNKSLEFRGNSEKVDFDNFDLEISGRMSSMAKRNVANTSTIMLPTKNSKMGVPMVANLACVEDFTDKLNTANGASTEQDIHDGSSIIDYAYSRMLDESYPGKGYKGTKKQFGVLITPFSCIVKKDAETVLTNDKIRNSKNVSFDLDTQVLRLKNIKKKMLSIPIGNIEIEKVFPVSSNYLVKNGKYYRLSGYTIKDGKITTSLTQINNDAKKTFIDVLQVTSDANTLYDVWEALGGEYSMNDNLEFSENSNELLYDLVTSYKVNDEYPLKTKMIHIVSNKSAIKSGASNVNHKNSWIDGTPLMFSTFENRHMGVQLDANHEADASEIKEPTQVISSLAQGASTSELAHEAYEAIAAIIKKAATPYINVLNLPEETQQDAIYRTLARKFTKEILSKDEDTVAKAIVESLPRGTKIPLSNQDFFQSFVKNVISRMNDEFITRHYRGLGVVLNPSHKMIQIYSDSSGKTYKQDDILKLALANYTGIEEKTNDQIFEDFVASFFADESVTIDQVEPADIVVEIDDAGARIGEIQNLNTVEKYFNFLRTADSNKKYAKIHNIPRDLKPAGITFKVNGVSKNMFSLDPSRLKYYLMEGNLNPEDADYKILNNFIKIIPDNSGKELSEYLKDNKALVNKYLTAWMQRDMQLLDKGRVMKDVTPEQDFSLFFAGDNLLVDIFEDVEQLYEDSNSYQITDYKFSDPEIIMANMHKTTFDTGNDSVANIQSQGTEYFRKKLVSNFAYNKKTNASLILKRGKTDAPVHVVFVDTLPPADKSLLIKDDIVETPSGPEQYFYRVDRMGNTIYTLPPNSVAKLEDGKEMLYILATESKYTKIDDKVNIYSEIKDDLSANIDELLKSFDGKLLAVIPTMGSKLNTKSLSKNGRLFNNPVDQVSIEAFKRYYNYSFETKAVNNSIFDLIKDNFFDYLSKRRYASWEKSREIVALRIPSQSMQSFMPMKIAGYHNIEGNDAFVSIFQIFLQGSDFDIDKAYTLGYDFNNNGEYDFWNDNSYYETKEDLDALEALPMPSGVKVELSTLESATGSLGERIIQKLSTTLGEGAKIDITKELLLYSTAKLNKDRITQIQALNAALRKIGNNTLVTISSEDSNILSFIDEINNHNLSKRYLTRGGSIKNSTVSKIKRIISTPSNQISATSPIEVESLRNATKVIPVNKDKIVSLSPYNPVSAMKQQRDASVGKDDVGISANGVKVFFALTDYFNTKYNKVTSILADDYAAFSKAVVVNGKSYNIGALSDIKLSRVARESLQNLIPEVTLPKSDAALIISAFVSAATDNAKELLMAKYNASVELASMHLYMFMLGFSQEDVALFMNSPVARVVAEGLATNKFEKDEVALVDNILNKIVPSDENMSSEVKNFKIIYEGAQEMKVLAKLLGINQRTSANVESLNSYLTTLETAMYAREKAVAKTVASPKINSLTTAWRNMSYENENIIDAIQRNNPLATREFIVRTLTIAENLEISGGRFRYKNYMDNSENGEKYREATKAYYNLLKSTVNIFDVIEKVPHFAAMISGMRVSHEMLKYSAKYNYIYNYLPDVVEKRAWEFRSANKKSVKNYLSDEAFKVKMDKTATINGLLGFDKFLVASWLRGNNNAGEDNIGPSDLIFNANALMEMAGVSKVKFYTEDTLTNPESTITITPKSAPFIIDLKTDYGIANFKVLMEKVLYPALRKFDSPLINSLRVNSRMNKFGQMATKIESTFNISELNSPVSLDKFQQLLSDFNNLDTNSTKTGENWVGKVKNISNKEIKWRDLFFVYNLVVNNDSFGPRSLSALLKDYKKESDTLHRDFLLFSSKVDEGVVNIFDIAPKGLSELEKADYDTKVENALMYYTFNFRGELNMPAITSKRTRTLRTPNGDFTVMTSFEPITPTINFYNTIGNIMKILRSNALVVTFNCE